ncbi:MAG TPA: hypothetical protein VNU71_03575 [Burkholderiaceae bacterium]|nr:hypothetical protein [Burkholderiaceae bacterium]
MQIVRFVLFASATFFMMGVRAQFAIEPRTENEKVFIESVKKRLSPCFTMLGVDPSIPVAANRPLEKELLAAVLLPAGGPLVNDGYNYMLLIHGPSNSAFVVQFGGFGGSQAIFGPIPLATTCQ